MKGKADYDPRAGTAKPGMVIMIGVKSPKKKDSKKKYGVTKAATMRHQPLPKPRDVSMRGIGNERMAGFARKLGELDAYDQDDMDAARYIQKPPVSPQNTMGVRGTRTSNLHSDLTPEQFGRHQAKLDALAANPPKFTGMRPEYQTRAAPTGGARLPPPLRESERGRLARPLDTTFNIDPENPNMGRVSAPEIRTGEPMDIAFRLLKRIAAPQDFHGMMDDMHCDMCMKNPKAVGNPNFCEACQRMVDM